MLASALGVVALGRPRAQNRLRGGAIFRLGQKLLVGPLLHLSHSRERALLFHPDLSLFGHRGASIDAASSGLPVPT